MVKFLWPRQKKQISSLSVFTQCCVSWNRVLRNTPVCTVGTSRAVLHTCDHHSIPLPPWAPHATRQLCQASSSVLEVLVLWGDGIIKSSRGSVWCGSATILQESTAVLWTSPLLGLFCSWSFVLLATATNRWPDQVAKEIPWPSPSEEPGFSHLLCLGDDGKPSGLSFHQKSRLTHP